MSTEPGKGPTFARLERPAAGAHESGLRGTPLLAALLTFFPLLALYVRTMLPDVGFWDTAEFQTVGEVLGIAHPTGYPAYTLLAWLGSVVLQPFGEPALRANLLSALLAAAGSGVAAATVTLLTGRAVVGIAAGIALGLSVPAWSVSLRADAHALHLALVALLLLLLVGWQLAGPASRRADVLLLAAAVAFGISLGNHGLTVLLAPGIALFVLLSYPRLPLERPRLVLACAAALVLTTVLLYLYLPLRSAMDPPLDYANPETWDGFRYLVFAEQFRGSFRGFPPLLDGVLTVGRETLTELGLFAVLAVLGAVAAALRRPQLVVLLVAWFVLNWAFALGYVNADIERYHLAPLLAAAVLGGLGAAALLDVAGAAARRWSGTIRRRVAWQANANGPRVAGALALAALLVVPLAVSVPQRFRAVDLSGPTAARQWLDAVLPQLEQDAIVVSWWSFSTTLWYAQFVEGRRPDIFVADDRVMIDQDLGTAMEVVEYNLGRRPVYLIRLPYDIAQFERRFALERLDMPGWGPDAWVYRVEGLLGVD